MRWRGKIVIGCGRRRLVKLLIGYRIYTSEKVTSEKVTLSGDLSLAKQFALVLVLFEVTTPILRPGRYYSHL
jgi:hypothetical protein